MTVGALGLGAISLGAISLGANSARQPFVRSWSAPCFDARRQFGNRFILITPLAVKVKLKNVK
tara:strand:+ start:309 stop:497 length:189 start_codon:yes stop_codon:yes gene_type:complete